MVYADVCREMRECFGAIALDSECRAVVLSGNGLMFTAGLDLVDAADVLRVPKGDTARNSAKMHQFILSMQVWLRGDNCSNYCCFICDDVSFAVTVMLTTAGLIHVD